MGRKCAREPIDNWPHACYFKCGAVLQSKYAPRAVVEKWRWFTGYGTEPLHFCPRCQLLRKNDIEDIYKWLNRKPEGWPNKRVQVPEFQT